MLGLRWILFCRGGSLLDEDRDAMTADAVEKLRYRTIVEIGEVCPVQPRVGRESVGKIEAEGQLSLEPGLHGVTIRRDHFGWLIGRKRGNMQIGYFADECSAFQGGAA